MTTYAPSSQAGLATFYRALDPLDARSYADPLPTLPKPAALVIPPPDRVVTPVLHGGARS